jgi:hypothetical protein
MPPGRRSASPTVISSRSCQNTRSKRSLTSGVAHLASLHGPDSSAMLVASMAGPGYVFEERSTESTVSPLLPEAKITWGERGRASSRIGYIPYRLFQIDGQPLSCAGFAQTVGRQGTIACARTISSSVISVATNRGR